MTDWADEKTSELIKEWAEDRDPLPSNGSLLPYISRALREERERCAKLAETTYPNEGPLIADAIRTNNAH